MSINCWVLGLSPAQITASRPPGQLLASDLFGHVLGRTLKRRAPLFANAAPYSSAIPAWCRPFKRRSKKAA
jgi:hypothetical protein